MRLSEVYASVQGEGPRFGVPTVFLRFAGCNLSCPGWPCDTQHAIDPKLYRHEWREFGAPQIFDAVMEAAENSGATNVCFTGGEPFLQKPEDLRTIAQLLHAQGMTLEVFTNGTLEWPDWAIYTFKFVMDWKLIGSGETLDPLGPVMRNATRLSIKDAIKFTCANKDDLNEAYNVWIRHFFGERADLPEFFCGPVWDKMEPVEVVDFILRAKVPWRLNIQAHKYIWPPDERAV